MSSLEIENSDLIDGFYAHCYELLLPLCRDIFIQRVSAQGIVAPDETWEPCITNFEPIHLGIKDKNILN